MVAFGKSDLEMAQLEELSALLDAPQADLRAVLKNSDETLAVLGTWQDMPAVFKLFRQEDGAELAQNAADALGQVAGRITRSDCGVVALLHKFDHVPVVVMSEAPGLQVSRLLTQLPVMDRGDLLLRAAHWLTDCAGDDSYMRGLPARRALKGIKALSMPRTSVGHTLRERLTQMAEELRGQKIIWAPTHGDFSPVNLYDNGSVLTAFDMQGVPNMPLARVAAQFLVSKDMGMPLDKDLLFGLNRMDAEHFLGALPAPVAADQAALAFYVGERLLRQFARLRRTGMDDQRKLVRKRINAFLSAPLL